MNARTMLIVGALAAGLWWWKKRGSAATAVDPKNTSQAASTAQDAEGWMGAWGINK